MSKWEDSVLLTKSDKHGGYCVVALRMKDKKLIRFVSSNELTHGAISQDGMIDSLGNLSQPLDRVNAPVKGPHPAPHQPENHLLFNNSRFSPIEKLDLDYVLSLCPVQRTGPVFGTYGYRIDEYRLPDHSVEMIEVQDLYLTDSLTSRRPKATFTFDGHKYERMAFTDPDFSFASLDPSYYTVQDGTKVLRRAVLVVSLPDVPFDRDGYYYIFVAKVFPLPPKD